MEKKVFLIKRGWLILIFLFILIPQGCDSGPRYIGTYVSVEEGEPSRMKTLLTLKDGDNGRWTTRENEVTFRWTVKGKEIRLHTNDGGVITGKIYDHTITLTLPGNKLMTFKKVLHQTDNL